MRRNAVIADGNHPTVNSFCETRRSVGIFLVSVWKKWRSFRVNLGIILGSGSFQEHRLFSSKFVETANFSNCVKCERINLNISVILRRSGFLRSRETGRDSGILG